MKVRTGTAVAAALVTMAGAAMAEDRASYGEARGWSVMSVSQDGGFLRCVATNSGVGFTIELSSEGWVVGVQGPPGAPSEYDAHLDVPPQSFPATFYSGSDGRHLAFLSDEAVAAIRNGSQIAYYVDGGEVARWPLAGTGAAMLKLGECVERGGVPDGGAPTP